MTYRFPAVLCSRVSFRLSVRLVVSRVILRGSTLYCFSHCPIRAYIVDVGPVDVGADHKGVIPLGKPFGKFHAQAVGFLRGDLAGLEGLTHLIGDYIVRAPHPPGGGDILALCQQKFRDGGPAVTGIAGDEPAAVRLLRIGRIVDDVADGPALCAALADVQRDDTGGGHGGNLLLIFTGIDILSESAYNNKYKAGNGVCLSKR